MSYILDSLKKSEQKRQQKGVPDLHTVHVADPPRRRAIWPYLLLSALFINAALLLWWLGFWAPTGSEIQSTASVEQMTTLESATPPVAVEPPAISPVVPGTVEKMVEAEASSRVLPTPALSAESSDAITKLPTTTRPEPSMPESKTTMDRERNFEAEGQQNQRSYRPAELPPQIRAQLPASVNLTLHYFSSNAANRMVRINGKNLHQGDELQVGVSVDEITPDGVVLLVPGYRVWVEKP